jgi:transposase
LLYNVRIRLITPPHSPDINPIENLWHLLDLELRKRNIYGKSDLKRVICEEWLQIPAETTKKLVESMPRKLQAVIDANGMHT